MNPLTLSFDGESWVLSCEGRVEPIGRFATRSEARLHCAWFLNEGGVVLTYKLDGTVDDRAEFPHIGDEGAGSLKEESMPGIRPYMFDA